MPIETSSVPLYGLSFMGNTASQQDRNSTGDETGTPRWVKVFGTIALIVFLLFLALMFVGGGDHSPSRHFGHKAWPSSEIADSGGCNDAPLGGGA